MGAKQSARAHDGPRGGNHAARQQTAQQEDRAAM